MSSVSSDSQPLGKSKDSINPKRQLKKTFKYLKKIEHYLRMSIAQPDDIENLHQLRVNIRNFFVNFSFLRLFYPSFKRKIILSGIKALKDCSDHIRDFDVFIEYIETIFEIEKETNSPKNGIDALYQQLLIERKANYAELHKIFFDFMTFDMFKYWRSLLKEHAKFTRKNQKKYVVFLTNRIKESWYEFEEKINVNVDDEEELHQLRIAGKKFRYSFQSLKEFFPTEIVEDISRIMADIQESLGTINDCKVILLKLDQKKEQNKTLFSTNSQTISQRYFFRLIQEKKKIFLSQRDGWNNSRSIEKISAVIYNF